jgi:hypothetical protein
MFGLGLGRWVDFAALTTHIVFPFIKLVNMYFTLPFDIKG